MNIISLTLAMTLWFAVAALGETVPSPQTNLVNNGGLSTMQQAGDLCPTGPMPPARSMTLEKHEGNHSYKLTNKSRLAAQHIRTGRAGDLGTAALHDLQSELLGQGQGLRRQLVRGRAGMDDAQAIPTRRF